MQVDEQGIPARDVLGYLLDLSRLYCFALEIFAERGIDKLGDIGAELLAYQLGLLIQYEYDREREQRTEQCCDKLRNGWRERISVCCRASSGCGISSAAVAGSARLIVCSGSAAGRSSDVGIIGVCSASVCIAFG